MHVDAAVEGFQRVALERVHDLVARQHPARALGQHGQELELVAGEVAGLAAQARLACAQVDFELAEDQDLVVTGFGRRAPQQGLDTRQQFTRLERLGQVVVGAQLQANDAVHGLATRGQHQQRQPARAGLGAQLAREVQAIAVGQHQVQQQGVIGPLFQPVAASGQGTRGVHFETVVAQVGAHHVGQAQVVIDQQQSARQVALLEQQNAPVLEASGPRAHHGWRATEENGIVRPQALSAGRAPWPGVRCDGAPSWRGACPCARPGSCAARA